MAKDSPYIHAMFIKICLYISRLFLNYTFFNTLITPKKMFGGRFLEKSLPNNYMCNLYPYIEIHNRHNHEIQLQAAATSEWCHTLKLKSMVNTPPASVFFMPNLEDHPTYP